MQTSRLKLIAVATSCVAMAAFGGQPPSVVRGDLDGDGLSDQATLVQHSDYIALTIRRAASNKDETMEFAVSPGVQAAVCQLPATLSAAEVFCAPMDDPLPGCKEAPGTIALEISDGACDAIHLYFDHEAHEMAWWRL